MGVRQLTTFVKQNEQTLKEEVNIKNSSIVIDGYGLLAMLMRKTALQYGGNYRDLYKVFFDFFSLLCFHEVTTYVILDGGNNFPIKLNTWVKRKEKTIAAVRNFYTQGRVCYDLPKPLFTRLVFIQVLEDLHIKYVFAEREADAVTAVIGNKINSYVLTNDSDFFIFNVEKGVISVEDILNMTKENNIMKVYHRENLIKLLAINKECIMYLPVIFGCDYSDDVILGRIQEKLSISHVHSMNKKFDIIKGRLKNSPKHFIDCLNNDNSSKDLIEEIEKILGEYQLENVKEESEKMLSLMFSQVKPKIDVMLFNSTNHDREKLLNVLKELIHCGKIHGSILDIFTSHVRLHGVLAENIARSSCANTSQNLRKYLYGILFKSCPTDVTITEYVRKGFTMKDIKIAAKSSEHPDVTHDTNMLALLCKIMNFDDSTVNDTLKEHLLFIITTNYLIKESRNYNLFINIDHLEALILMYVMLKQEVPYETNNVNFHCDLAHICCCWQGVVFECMILNTLFGEPLKIPPVYHLFDGELIHWLFTRFNDGKFPTDFILSEDLVLYNELHKLLVPRNIDNRETVRQLRSQTQTRTSSSASIHNNTRQNSRPVNHHYNYQERTRHYSSRGRYNRSSSRWNHSRYDYRGTRHNRFDALSDHNPYPHNQ